MADIKNKNELKRRIDLFLDDFSHEEYMINEPFCKETMRMMREFIGHASHLLDCTDAKIKKAKRTARNKAIDDVIKTIDDICDTERDRCNDFGHCSDCYKSGIKEIAEQLKGGV